MILQTDYRLSDTINATGCYFMSILFLANKYTGINLSTVMITKIFKDCEELGYIEPNGYIISAENIFKHLGLNVKYTNKHESKNRKCASDEIEILCFQNSRHMTHFCVGDGNGFIAYNPMGINNPSFKLLSKRIFKLL